MKTYNVDLVIMDVMDAKTLLLNVYRASRVILKMKKIVVEILRG